MISRACQAFVQDNLIDLTQLIFPGPGASPMNDAEPGTMNPPAKNPHFLSKRWAHITIVSEVEIGFHAVIEPRPVPHAV